MVLSFLSIEDGVTLYFTPSLGFAPALLAFSIGPVSLEPSRSEESPELESKPLLLSTILLSAFTLEREARGARRWVQELRVPGLTADLFHCLTAKTFAVDLFNFYFLWSCVSVTTKISNQM